MARPSDPDQAIRRWSEVLREFDVLEPWLTESHYDDRYWDDVATGVVKILGDSVSEEEATDALRQALRATFPSADL